MAINRLIPGERVRYLRNEIAMKQDELANRAGVSPVTLRNFENGKTVPNNKTIDKIVKALEESIHAWYMIESKILINEGKSTSELDEKIDRLLMLFTNSVTSPSEGQALDQSSSSGIKTEEMLFYFDSLNDEGQDKVIDYAKDLNQSPNYKKGKANE